MLTALSFHPPAMQFLSLCLCSPSLTPIFPFSYLHFRSLGFVQFNPKLPLRITPIRSRNSSKEQLSLPHNEFELESGGEDEEDEEDDEFDEYEDDDIAADEYTIDSDASEEEEEDEEGWSDSDTVAPLRLSEEDKADRVKMLLEQVREFGAEIIDYQEVAAIYDFPIDRFQVYFLQSL